MRHLDPSMLDDLHLNLPMEAREEPACGILLATTPEAFDSLEKTWNSLLNGIECSVFQTFEWLRTWWKYKAEPGDTLHILVFYKRDLIVGIAPLYIHPVRALGMTVARRLTFIGTGLSDYVDLIVTPGYESDVYDALCRLLASGQTSWDIFDLEDVNESSHLVTHLPGVLKRNGLNVYTYQGNVCPFILLPDSPDDLFKGAGSTGENNYRRKNKKLQSKFSSEIKIFQSEKDDIDTGVADFCRIHGKRWKSMGYPSAFDDEQMQRYHIEFSRKFAHRGWLRLYVLYIHGQPIAVTYNFNYRKRIYMYHSNAHGPDDVMRCSPGLVVRCTSMLDGIREGMKIFDYLRGNESYKYQELHAKNSKNFLLRVMVPKPLSFIRFYLFLQTQMAIKSVNRSKREYYGYRRFVITDKPSFVGKLVFVGGIFVDLLKISYDFIYRHSPLRSINALSIRVNDKEEEDIDSADADDDAQNNSAPGSIRKEQSP